MSAPRNTVGRVVRVVEGDRIDYLQRDYEHGKATSNCIEIGRGATAGVFVYTDASVEHPAGVVLSENCGPFHFQNKWTVEKARLLAQALLKAADDAEALNAKLEQVTA